MAVSWVLGAKLRRFVKVGRQPACHQVQNLELVLFAAGR
jgi:hypothetical protein